MIRRNLKSNSFHWMLMSVLLISVMLYSASTLPIGSATDGSATVFVDPAESVFVAPAVGTLFDVNVTIANITAFEGAQYTLSWNTTMLACTKITEVLYHTVTPPDQWTNIWSVKLSINKTGGYVSYAQTYQDTAAAVDGGYAPINVTTANYPPEGKLALATLTFNITAVPPPNTQFGCDLALSDVIIGDIGARPIPTVNVGGHYVVYGGPETLIHNVVKDSTNYVVVTVSNASVMVGSMMYVANYTITFNVTGADGTTAYVNITIPKNLVALALPTDVWNVTVNGATVTPIVTENSTHTFLYLTTGLSTKTVTIIGTVPEFPALMAIPLLMVLTLIAVGLRKRKETVA